MALIYDTWGFPGETVDESLSSEGIYSSNCLINGKDGLLNYGILIENVSISALMSPPPLKEILENDIPNVDGVEIYDNAKINKRTLSLSFMLTAKNQTEALSRYNSFIQQLFYGRFTLIIPRVNMKFRLLYINCTTYKAWFEGSSKLVITVVEPDPTNRA